jgi:translocator protein
MDISDWIALVAFAALNVAAAASGALFKPGAWYASLNRPGWTPPNWAFPLIWLVMFSLNAAAGWLVWRGHDVEAAGPLALYVGSLFLNAAWSWLFFGRRRMDLALIDVVLLWGSIAGLILLFAPLSRMAALMLVPYLAWVGTAALLNVQMIRLNPGKARGA